MRLKMVTYCFDVTFNWKHKNGLEAHTFMLPHIEEKEESSDLKVLLWHLT